MRVLYVSVCMSECIRTSEHRLVDSSGQSVLRPVWHPALPVLFCRQTLPELLFCIPPH